MFRTDLGKLSLQSLCILKLWACLKLCPKIPLTSCIALDLLLQLADVFQELTGGHKLKLWRRFLGFRRQLLGQPFNILA
jgi:hypothetical protein